MEPANMSVTYLESRDDGLEQMIRDVRAGLLSDPKDLSPWPKYFYDEEGSRLFEEITRLPEYYQTRAELSILRGKSEEIVRTTGCRELVELGSGSANKTRALLDAVFEAPGTNGKVLYAPLDVSESALRESGRRLLSEYPKLEVRGYVGDFDSSLDRLLNDPSGATGGRLVIFLGGTIGNFAPEKRAAFLSKIRSGMQAGDHALIGVDLVKDRETLEPAYDDDAGVTARFNKNLLKVINDRLGGDFDPALFTHRAFYNEDESRIEMWLDSAVEQEVHLKVPDLGVRFAAGEGVRTEVSAKFTAESAVRMFEEAGLVPLDLYTDERNLFGLALGRAE